MNPQAQRGTGTHHYQNSGKREEKGVELCLGNELPHTKATIVKHQRKCLLYAMLQSTSTCIEFQHMHTCVNTADYQGIQSLFVVNSVKLHLRWLPRVLLRLNSVHYHCLPNVSINRAFKNDASNPKHKGNHFST